MELPDFSLPLIQGFLICLARVAAMFAAIPVFSGGQVPHQLRLGVAVMFAMLVYPVVKDFIPVETITPLELGLIIASEVIFGLLVGFLAQLVFMAAEFAGSLIGYQMGFAAANIFDPTTQAQVALISQFQGIF
ncbi:MAG: flagellar biosynthetic protein FliR, partial [Desulfuromonadales bacterium]|nr:flagellar biosynthetic protein FliR [Desulfuromonadales bacterium]